MTQSFFHTEHFRATVIALCLPICFNIMWKCVFTCPHLLMGIYAVVCVLLVNHRFENKWNAHTLWIARNELQCVVGCFFFGSKITSFAWDLQSRCSSRLLFFAFLVFVSLFGSFFHKPQMNANSLGCYECIHRVSRLVKPTVKPDRNVAEKLCCKLERWPSGQAQDAHTSKKRLKQSVYVCVMLYATNFHLLNHQHWRILTQTKQ